MRCAIYSVGAQITEFAFKKTGINYMLQGDSDFWAGRNPILFPIIGNTYSGNYYIDGKKIFSSQKWTFKKPFLEASF